MVADLTEVDWPFLFAADPSGRGVGWAVVRGPIVTHAHHAQLAELSRAGLRFAGVTSYMSFPAPDGGDPRDYGTLCEAWCHGFRDPEAFLPPVPRALISESDFVDCRLLPAADRGQDGDRPWFAYVGASEGWKKGCKNWELAARCVPRLCRELDLDALVIGAPDAEFPTAPRITFSPEMAWPGFLGLLRRARFLFVPNVFDASPRVLAEALCLDVPLVVHRRILGGWKYVNAFTGTFFDGEDDVVSAADRCLARPRSPRSWFRSQYGPYLSGQRLLRLLRAVDPCIAETSHLVLSRSLEVASGAARGAAR